jgi:SynChlorMet cassette protein ScmD
MNLRLNPDVVFREDFDEIALIFNPDSGKSFSLNRTGVIIWKALRDNKSVEQILAEFECNCYNIPANVEEHLSEFVSALLDNGLAEYVN